MRIEEKVARRLIGSKKTIALAESCSGGLLAHRLTNIPGSSNFLKLGLITYSDDAKSRLLKISPQSIRKHGAVSRPVAEAMAEGIRKLLGTDFGISITGIAGPTGGSPQKPVGLTYIAVSGPTKTVCKKHIFKGNRLKIKTQATSQALALLLRNIPAKSRN